MFRVEVITRRACTACLFIASTMSLTCLRGQDLRAVSEPLMPAVCVALKANMTSAVATSGDLESRAVKSGSDDIGLDTARIGEALARCGKGKAVELSANGVQTAFLTGPIALSPGVTLLLDKGVTLYAARNPESYALSPGSCGLVNDAANGCRPLITAKGASGSGIMGEGAIDGQGGARLIVDGRPSAKTWWDLAEEARTVGHRQAPDLIDVEVTDDFTLYRIVLKNAPASHLIFHRGDGLTVWDVRIDTPRTARNTEGIDLSDSRNITIAQSWIRTGDDDIALKAEEGPSSNISVLHNHIYWGHGLSIGGETAGGISDLRVEDLSLDGPDTGIRIKSNAAHGGLVQGVLYSDVCVRGAKSPIFFDTAFSFPGKGVPVLPVYRDIVLRNVRMTGGGRVQFNGFDKTHRVGVTLDGVVTLDSPARYRSQTTHTDLTLGPGPVNLVFIGDDSTVDGKQVKGNLPGCDSKFVPFP